MSLKAVRKTRELQQALQRELEGVDVKSHLLPVVRMSCQLAELYLFSRTHKHGAAKKKAVVAELLRLYPQCDPTVLDGLVENVVAELGRPTVIQRAWRWSLKFLAKPA